MEFLREHYGYLSDEQFAVLHKVQGLLGEAAVGAMLHLPRQEFTMALDRFREGEASIVRQADEAVKREAALAEGAARQELDQHRVALEQRHLELTAQVQQELADLERCKFVRAREHDDFIARIREELTHKSTPHSTKALSLKVSKYGGEENGELPRWIVEVELAMAAAQTPEVHKVAFAISWLTDRARTWALNKLLADAQCFPNWETLKVGLRRTFLPPKSEQRFREEFLKVRQTKSLHEYVQRVRYLTSCIVDNPIDEATKIGVFMAGLRQSRAKTELYRSFPETLEDAIEIAMHEDFSARAAQGFRIPDIHRRKDGDDMDICAMSSGIPRKQKAFDSRPPARQCYQV
jgi:Retrotransposon gag protein